MQVKVDIFYEALCGDTFVFINEQLVPLYNEFRDNLDIFFIPFGKANVRKSTTKCSQI